jgi:hypothetical protein
MFDVSIDAAGWIMTVVVAVAFLGIVAATRWRWRWLPFEVNADGADQSGHANREHQREANYVHNGAISAHLSLQFR